MEHKVADPAPLGLAAFAMTTFCLSSANAGWWDKGGASAALALALIYGGTAQFAAGMWEFVRKNTFGALAFTSYGAFWIGFYILLKIPAIPPSTNTVGIFLLAWAIFTAYMSVAALRVSGSVLLVFVLLTATFIFLAIGQNNLPLSGHDTMHTIGGFLGLATAAAAWYASFGAVVNSTFGKEVVPLFPLKR